MQRRIRRIERHQLPYYLKVFNPSPANPLANTATVS
nr:pilus assembly protein PilZ [Gammaproteobacteria bacterium]